MSVTGSSLIKTPYEEQLKCSKSMYFYNSVLHYLYSVADDLVIYAKITAFKTNAKAINSRPRPDSPRPRTLALRPRSRLNMPGVSKL